MNYSISDVAKEFHIPTSTLRYYENQGLMPPIKRGENGQRYYDEADLDWLSVIMCMKGTNMSISDIRKFAKLNAMGDETLQERLNMVIAHRKQTLEKIQELESYMDHINFKVMYFTEALKQGTEKNMKLRYYPTHIHKRASE